MLFHYHKYRGVPSFILAGLLILPLIGAACSSRYRMSLYLVETPLRRRVVIREAFYVKGLAVSSAFSADFLMPGPGTLCAVAFFTRETGDLNAGPSNLIGFRAHNEYRLIAPLPQNPAVGPLNLTNNTFVRKLSFEETDEASRIFLFSSGQMTLDSTKKSDWFTTIAATFRSQGGDSVRLEGQIRLKERDTFAFSNTRYEPTR